jgi:hypothetical protein
MHEQPPPSCDQEQREDQGQLSLISHWKNIFLIVIATAFGLAFPFAFAIAWWPGTYIGVYLGATCLISVFLVVVYAVTQAEKSRSIPRRQSSDLK